MFDFFDHSEPPESKDLPICPICGAETDTFFKNNDSEIVGCDECVRKVDAWEVA